MIFNRYAICFQHDNSPLDKALYVHKAQAKKDMEKMANSAKLKVSKVKLEINLSEL